MRLSIICTFFLMPLFVFAQQVGNTQISGTIKGAVSKNITLITGEQHKSSGQQSFDARLNSNDEFTFVVPLTEPQFAVLQYGRNIVVNIYIEPGDQLRVDTDGNDFVKGVTFSGTGGANNRILKFYWEQYKEVQSQFQMKQYKKGGMYYTVSPEIDQKMTTLGYTSFEQEMRQVKDNKLATIDLYQRSYPEISPTFVRHMRSEIEYEWAYNMLLYGYAFGYKNGVPDSYFNFANNVLINDDGLVSSPKYRRYIKGGMNYKYDKGAKDAINQYVGQYELSKQMLSGKTQSWFQSDVLTRGLHKSDLGVMIDPYNEFVSGTLYYEYAEPVLTKFYEKNLYAVGSPAPNFTLTDINGNVVSLSDYAGKVIYLDFWATWCPPCLKKLGMMQHVSTQIGRDDVVFIHISLDRTEEAWRNTLSSRVVSGIHLYAQGGYKADVVSKFNVKAIPEYYIINKNGTFVQKPSTVNAYSIQECLEKLP